jgi:microcystin-dependent protein
MGAISKAWVVIADTAVDPDSPIDAALMTGLRDDTVHLREWIGFSYTGGAVQDHNHDGINSAAISGEVGFVRDWPGLALPGANWDWCDGGTLLRANFPVLQAVLMKSANVTISIAAPAVVNWVAHGLRTNMPVRFFTTGGLPTGITAGTHGGAGVGTEYFVNVVNADNFNIAATPGGANIGTSGVQSGVHTAVVAPHGDGDGATTFHKPDRRGRGAAGRDDMGGTAANRITSGGSGILGNVPGRSGGAETVAQTAAQMAAHPHSYDDYYQGTNVAATVPVLSTNPKNPHSDAITSISESGATTPRSTNSAGSGTAMQNTQPTQVTDFIIRVS